MIDIAYKPNEKINPNVSAPLDTKQKNLMDYLAKYGQRVALRAVTDGAGALIYKIPEGKTLFLLSSSIQAEMGSNDYAKLYIQTGDQVINELVHSADTPADHHISVDVKNYSPPLRINWGESLYGESTDTAVSVIVGYVVNTSEIY